MAQEARERLVGDIPEVFHHPAHAAWNSTRPANTISPGPAASASRIQTAPHLHINPNYKQPPGKAELPHLQVVRTPRKGHRHRNYKLISSHNLSGEISLAFSAELFYCFLPPGNVWLVWPGGTLFIYSTKRGKKYLYPTLTCIYHLLLCEISKPVLYG